MKDLSELTDTIRNFNNKYGIFFKIFSKMLSLTDI